MTKFSTVKVLSLLTELAEVASEDDNFIPNGSEIEKLADTLFNKGGLEAVGVKPSSKALGIVDSIRTMLKLGIF